MTLLESIVKGTAFEVGMGWAPLVKTVTWAVPAMAISAEAICAANSVWETNVRRPVGPVPLHHGNRASITDEVRPSHRQCKVEVALRRKRRVNTKDYRLGGAQRCFMDAEHSIASR